MMTAVAMQQTSENSLAPVRATEGSFGYDLAVVDDETVRGRETRILPCGLRLARDLPHDASSGLAMLILPRSSLSLKYGLILPNSPGLIDADYSEPLGILVHNLQDEPVMIPSGTRVAQALFVRAEFPRIDLVDEADPDRSRGGFGSTG